MGVIRSGVSLAFELCTTRRSGASETGGKGGTCPSDMNWRAPGVWVLTTILDWSHLGLFALWPACWLQDQLRPSAPRPPRVAGPQSTLGPWRGIRTLLPTASAP